MVPSEMFNASGRMDLAGLYRSVDARLTMGLLLAPLELQHRRPSMATYLKLGAGERPTLH